MANQVHIGAEILDIDKVYAAVHELTNIEKNKAIKYGLRKAGNIFIAGGRQRLRARMKNPKGVTQNLMRSFVLKVKRFKLGALAGFNQNYSAYKKGEMGYGSHAALVDRGSHGERFWKTRDRRSTGVMPALSFWQDTYDQDGAKAVEAIRRGVEHATEMIIRKR